MRVKWKCSEPNCEAEGWANGWSEADTNSAGVRDDDPMEGACEHIIAGGAYTLIDFDASSDFEDDYL